MPKHFQRLFLCVLHPSCLPSSFVLALPCSKNLEKKSYSKITQHIHGKLWARIWVNAFSKKKKSKLMQLSTISCPFVILTSSRAKHPIYLGPSVSVILPHSDFAPTQAWHKSAFAAGWFKHSGGASSCIKFNPCGRLCPRPFCLCRPPSPGWLRRHPGEGIQLYFRSCSSWRERQTDGLFHPDYPDFLNLEIHALKKCKLPKGVAKHVPGCANECK